MDTHTFTVTVSGCTAEQAQQVLAERIGPDEDYGFDYRIDWTDTQEPEHSCSGMRPTTVDVCPACKVENAQAEPQREIQGR